MAKIKTLNPKLAKKKPLYAKVGSKVFLAFLAQQRYKKKHP